MQFVKTAIISIAFKKYILSHDFQCKTKPRFTTFCFGRSSPVVSELPEVAVKREELACLTPQGSVRSRLDGFPRFKIRDLVQLLSWSPKVARSRESDNAILEKGRVVTFSGIRSWPQRLVDHDSNWT